MSKLLLLLAFSAPLWAQSGTAYKWSAATLTLGTSLDVASSYGAYETNPLWRSANGRFEARGTALRFAFVGSGLLVQRFILRRHPSASKSLAVVNFISGATLGGIAARNFRVR